MARVMARKVVADIPVKALADEAPMYDRPCGPLPKPLRWRPAPGRAASKAIGCVRDLLANPNVASKKWIYRHYDSLVLSNTVVGPGSDAAVLRIKGSKRGIAMKVEFQPPSLRTRSLRRHAGHRLRSGAQRTHARVRHRPASPIA